jgi:hypothetical protein
MASLSPAERNSPEPLASRAKGLTIDQIAGNANWEADGIGESRSVTGLFGKRPMITGLALEAYTKITLSN